MAVALSSSSGAVGAAVRHGPADEAAALPAVAPSVAAPERSLGARVLEAEFGLATLERQNIVLDGKITEMKRVHERDKVFFMQSSENLEHQIGSFKTEIKELNTEITAACGKHARLAARVEACNNLLSP